MYSELGRLLWSSCPFLWNYVTMPGLLVFFTICIIHLYQKVPPYYIAWNSNIVRPQTCLPLPLWGPTARSPPQICALTIPRDLLTNFPAPGEPGPPHHMDPNPITTSSSHPGPHLCL